MAEKSKTETKVAGEEKTGYTTKEILFFIVSGELVCVLVPYVLLTGMVYKHIYDYEAEQAGPDFTRKPYVGDFWISIVSAFVIYFIKKWVCQCL